MKNAGFLPTLIYGVYFCGRVLVTVGYLPHSCWGLEVLLPREEQLAQLENIPFPLMCV